MKKLLRTLQIVLLVLAVSRPALAQWSEISLVDDQGIEAKNIQFVHAHGGTLYAGSFNRGLFRSDDDGDTWQPVNNGLTDLATRDLAFGDDDMYVLLGGNGPFRSTDGGETWTPPGTGLPDFFPSYASVAVFDGSAFAGTASNHQVFGVWRSDDDGATWRAVGDISTPHAVYGLFGRDGNLFAGTNNGVYRSQDKGETWTKLENGIPGNSYVRRFIAEGTDLFALADDGIYRSQDKGESWSRHTDGFPSFPQASGLAIRAGHLFTVVIRMGKLSGDVYYTATESIAWTADSDNLAEQMSAILGAHGNYVYASAHNGLWRRPLADFGISTVNRHHAAIPGSFRLEQNYPNPFNPSTSIRYTVPAAGRVSLKVYDALGRERATLLDRHQAAGTYTVAFDATDLPSGLYLYRLETGAQVETRVMTLLR